MSTCVLEPKSDLHLRELWTEGSACAIYSRSRKSWFNATIISIFNDKDGEWLKVRYNNTICKHIQRLCKDIKPNPIPINAMKRFVSNHTTFKNMSLCEYLKSTKTLNELLICGYLRSQTIQTIPCVIINLITELYHKPLDITEFDLKQTLGSGTFGTVTLCEHKQTSKQYAIKMLHHKRIIELKQEDHVRNERQILNEIHHPFIVSFLLSFEDSRCIYLVFEVLTMGCEFFDLLTTYDRLTLTQCVFYSAQIVIIYEYLHSKHIIYRDMKPENLMYTRDGYLKLIDFGFSKKVNDTNDYSTYTLCGTPEYLSPEMVLNKGHSFGVDWWALGVLIFEMYTGFTPFETVDCDHIVSIYANIVNHNEETQCQVLQYLDDAHLKDIVRRLLCKNPKQRLGARSFDHVDDVKSHPWFGIIDWDKIYNKEYINTPKHSPTLSKECPGYSVAVENHPFLYDF
eukprot:476313_1